MLCCAMIAMAQQFTVPVVYYKDGTAKSFVNTSDIKFKYLKNATINLQPNELLNYCGSAFNTKYEATTTIKYYGEGKSLLIFSSNKSYPTSNWTIDLNLGPITDKYNVYVETLPLTVLDPSATVRPVKFRASMSSNGATLAQTASDIITDANNIASVKVLENVEIPQTAGNNDVLLTLQSNVGTRETKNYTRTMYISSIILEPVGENGNAAVPSNPVMLLDGKQILPNADIDSVTVDVATLTLQTGKEEEFLKRRVHGTIHNYSKLKKLENVRFGLNVLDDVAGSIKYFSIPSINPNCTSVQNGNDLAVTFTMPPADNSAYYSRLYLVIGEDSIVSDKKYIAPTVYYQSNIDATLAKIIKQEQVPESYDVVSTVDITGLLEYLKTFNEELEISGLEPTATPGIYTVTYEQLLVGFEKDENLPVFPVGVTIINKTDNVELERYIVSTTQTSFPYVKPKDVRKGRLPDFISRDAKLTLFSKALEATGLDYALVDFIDKTYSCGEDSVAGNIPAVKFGGCNGDGLHKGNHLRYPANRKFKFTAFAETDDVYARYGINTLEDLKSYAKSVYDQVYPADAGKYDSDPTNPKSPLNRFIRYHLMDRFGSYGDWAPSGQIYSNNWIPDVADAEDYWETMSGEMIRFCRLSSGSLYANRKGLRNTVYDGCAGVRVLNDAESKLLNPDQDANRFSVINGIYFYLEDILAYTPTVRDNVLNRRLRFDTTTLSPDFMNQNARGYYASEILYMFKNDYVKNFKLSKDTQIGVHSDDMWWSSYLGNAVCIKGDFDFSVKIPTPPAGQYEVRLGYVARSNAPIMQTFWNDKSLGELDMTYPIWALAEQIGKDKGIKNPNYTPDGWEPEYEFNINDTGSEEHNAQVDAYLREYGYMKAMDSYRKGTWANSFRVAIPESMRRIFGTVDIKEGEECWLRFKKLSTDPDQELAFDYIELVPVGVIQAGEDRH